MHLPVIALPSTPGATLHLSSKSFANIAKAAEDYSASVRMSAQAGETPHPLTVYTAYKDSIADLAAIRRAIEAELSSIDQAIAVLDGEAAPASTHALVETAKQMKFAAAAFRAASSQLVRDKAAGLITETRQQLRATREAAARELGQHEHRLDAIRNKCADALRASIANYTGPYRISLKQAADLLGLRGIPDDDTPLPAPSFDPGLPGNHPARKAAVLHRTCQSREAEAELARQHAAAKLKKTSRPKTTADVVADELKQLGDE